MNNKKFIREEMLIGKENLEKLNKSKVAVFGIGGVGSFVCEGLVRAGIGNFILIDNDTISESNINRQIHSNINTIGKYKVDEMKERMLQINQEANIEVFKTFYTPDCEDKILDNSVDYIADAIDTVTSKLELIVQAHTLNIPIISSMGTGNKLNPCEFEVADIYKTSVCPLAKVIRKELKNRNINKLKVVYSKEIPKQIEYNNYELKGNRAAPASISFVPSVAGMIIASEVVKDLINFK